MTKDEALEEVQITVSKFNDFISDVDPGHAINIIKPEYTDFNLSRFADTCEGALSWIDEQMKLEKEKEKSSAVGA